MLYNLQNRDQWAKESYVSIKRSAILSDVMNNYSQGNIDLFTARPTINKLLEGVEQMEVIQDGEA